MPCRIAAFAFFAGLPFAQGLDAPAQQAWLAVGGGEMLWDELAAAVRLQAAGGWPHGPERRRLDRGARLDSPSDLAGARIHVEGLAADVCARSALRPQRWRTREAAAALADGRSMRPSGWGRLRPSAPDLQPLAQRLYRARLQPRRHGRCRSTYRKPLWDGDERRRPGDLRGLRGAGVSAVAGGCGGRTP